MSLNVDEMDQDDGGFVSDDGYDSEAELQEAFARGDIKPGLNIESYTPLKRIRVNNVSALQQMLTSFKQDLPWIERLDLTTDLAPMAPEMAAYVAAEEERMKKQVVKVKTPKSLDPTLDDFLRETTFHRQAQAAVLVGIPKLHSLGVLTKRPDDYFAQMVKTDEHMQKIRVNLLRKKAGQEVAEKVAKMRANKKLMKQRQTQAAVEHHKKKKEFAEEVKKYRQGARKDLDFLEPESKQKKKPKQPHNPRSQKLGAAAKRAAKDKKYGAGGKKRGRRNNVEVKKARAGAGKAKRAPSKAQRPGKERRKAMRSKNK